MHPKPFSISRPGMECRSLRAPTYPFPGTFIFERTVATVQLLLLSITGRDAEKDLDLPVDMTPIEERLEQFKSQEWKPNK